MARTAAELAFDMISRNKDGIQKCKFAPRGPKADAAARFLGRSLAAEMFISEKQAEYLNNLAGETGVITHGTGDFGGPIPMQAIRCPRCGRLTAEGDYGKLLVACTDRHRSNPDQEDSRFADKAYEDDPPGKICPGSETNGTVEEIPGSVDGFDPWNGVPADEVEEEAEE